MGRVMLQGYVVYAYSLFLALVLIDNLHDQLAADVEGCKQSIKELKTAMEVAQERQKAAKEECKKLERDMEEFKNNKEGKIEQLKVCLFKSLLLRLNEADE